MKPYLTNESLIMRGEMLVHPHSIPPSGDTHTGGAAT